MGDRIVGLDIGTSALRAVEVVVEDGRPPTLEAFGQVGLPPGAIAGGEVHDRAQVAAALRRLWRDGGFKSNRVRIGVAGLRAITREIELPPVAPEELDAAVALQAEDVLPFALEDTSISSAVVSRSEDSEGNPQLRVLVAAAHRELLDGIVAAVQEAGLEPEVIDLDPAALARAFTLGGASEEPEAIVSVGAGLTMVVVRQGGTLQFVRTIDIGGDTVTRVLAATLDLPRDDAEALKRRLSYDAGHDASAQAAVSDVVARLASEIKSSVRFYSSMPGRAAPTRVLVTGGASRTAGLVATLQETMDVPVLHASPLPFVDARPLGLSEREAALVDHSLAVPLGLTLNGPLRTAFDLMPPEVRARRAAKRQRRLVTLCAVGVLVILAAASAWRVLTVRQAESQISTLRSTVRTIQHVELPRYDKAVRVADQATTLQHQLAPLVSHEVDWLIVLNELGQYLPPSASLDGLQLSATDVPGTPAVAPASSAQTPSTATSQAHAPIGTGSTTVVTKTLTEVTQFGNTIAKASALSGVALSGAISRNQAGVSFPVSFSITSVAHTRRLPLFEEKIP